MSSVNPAAFRRLLKEIKQLQSEPPEGIRIVTDEENILDVTGIIQGPDGTPYQGGYFKIKFKFGEEFPSAPPKCWFVTRIFHPNVSKSGEICVNTLKKDWKREYGIAHILVTVKCLLIYPNPESALDEAAGKLLLEKYEDYCKHAKLMTSVHATPKTRPPEFDIPSVIPDSQPSSSTASTSASTTSTATLQPPTPASTIRHSSPAPRNSNSQNTTTSATETPTIKPISKSNSIAPTAATVIVEPLQPSTAATNVASPRVLDQDPTSPLKGIKSPTGIKSVGNQNAVATAGASAAIGGGGNVAVKRGNVATGGGAEKRKKGLRRL